MLYALGGGPLHGEKAVRIVYLDEAGISNPKQEPFVTVAGVIVHGDDELNRVENRLKKLVKKYIPEGKRQGFVFHAKEIFHGGRTMNRQDPNWSLQRRPAIATEL